MNNSIRNYMKGCTALALAAAMVCGAVRARAEDRIHGELSASPMTPVRGNIAGHVRSATDEGRMGGGTLIQGMSLVFAPSATQETALDALMDAQQDPTSPQYHQWITPEQYGARFGLSANDLNKVLDWLQAQGFTVNSVARSRNAVSFTGTALQVEKAFQTEMHIYSLNGVQHFANATAPSLPGTLTAMVTGIEGLHDFHPAPHIRTSSIAAASPGVSANFTSSESGSHYISPGDFATIYDVKPLYTAGYHGENQKIAVVGQTAVYSADLTAFRTAAGLPTLSVPGNYGGSSSATVPVAYSTTVNACTTSGNSSFCAVCVSSNSNYCTNVFTSDLPEADLDLELSSGVAYNSRLLYVYDPHGGVFNAYYYAITNDVAPVISVSYGDCEDYGLSDQAENLAEANSIQVYVKQGNTQGQTTIAASGDDGAADCDYTSGSTADDSAKYGLQVDIPADIPQVTAVGGTEFAVDAEACTSNCSGTTPTTWPATTYWSGTSGSDVTSSALIYIPEDAWNDDSITIPLKDGFSSSGGGISQFYSKPTWQTALTTPADTAAGVVTTQRDVPDIALAASPNHDGFLVCTQTFTNGTTPAGSSCQNGTFRYTSNQDLTVYGGTSVAAPSFAGILSLIEQKNATSYGNLNALLYSLAAGSSTYAADFHDVQPISSGVVAGANNNIDPCTTGTQNCTSGSLGYSTRTGYDLVTGLGSVDAYNLASSSSVLTSSTTTLSYSPTTVTTATSPVTLTATVESSGAVTTAPTGTVTFAVNGTALTTVTLTQGTNISTASTTTTFPNANSYTVTATYSGDSTYIGSSGSQTITVAPSGTAATWITASTSPSSAVTMGQSLTINSTVNSAVSGNITGVVTYTVNGTTIGTANVTSATGTTGTAAPLTIAVSTALGFQANTYNTINISYAGNSAYAASTGSTGITVNGAPTYSVIATPMTMTSTVNGTVATSTVTLTSMNGYTGTILTPCTSQTENNISISPNSLDLYFNCGTTINGSTTSNVTLAANGTATFPLTFELDTLASSGQSVSGSAQGVVKRYSVGRVSKVGFAGGGAALAGVLMLGLMGRKRRRIALMLCMLVFTGVFAGMGCGSGTVSNGGGSSTTSGINQAGTYTVTLTMVDTSGVSESTTFTVTIQ